MSLVNGGQSAIDSAPNTWLHTTPMFRFLHLKRTTMAALIFTSCKNATPKLP